MRPLDVQYAYYQANYRELLLRGGWSDAMFGETLHADFCFFVRHLIIFISSFA